MTSPAELEWERTSDVHWLLRRNGGVIYSVYRLSKGYCIYSYDQHIDATYDTLAEAQAVAIALIAMRGK